MRCMSKGDTSYASWMMVGGYKASFSIYLFFFQAEDGIRDLTVTGVQTCALPIYGSLRRVELYEFLHGTCGVLTWDKMWTVVRCLRQRRRRLQLESKLRILRLATPNRFPMSVVFCAKAFQQYLSAFLASWSVRAKLLSV